MSNRLLVWTMTTILTVPAGLLLGAAPVLGSHTTCPGSSSGVSDLPSLQSLSVGSSKWFHDDPISTVTYRITSLVGNADVFLVNNPGGTYTACHQTCSGTGAALVHTCMAGAGSWLLEVRCVSSPTGTCNYILERQ